MKKYVGLFSITAVIVMALMLWGGAVQSSPAEVKTVMAQPVQAQETITCGGKIERVFSKKVYADSIGIIKDLQVELGDMVTIGQPLFTVEPIQTDILSKDALEVYGALYGNSSSSAASDKSSGEESSPIKSPITGKVVSLSIS